MMRAVTITQPGGPEVLALKTLPHPTLRDGEVLIEVKAAGVNRPDLSQRAGKYPVPKDASPIPGLEVAGVICAIAGPSEGLSVGDRVMALVHGGGYAEYCSVDHRHVMKVPKEVAFVQAAAFPEVALTVEFNMIMRGGLRKGEVVLIHGGSSGIGSHAIARAQTLGATAITTSRGEHKCNFCRERGAAFAINSSVESWADEVMDFTKGGGVNVVLDMVGGDYIEQNLRCLADDGRYALISLQGGKSAEVNFEDVLRRRLIISGSTLRPLSVELKAAIVRKVRRDVLPLLAEGELTPPVFKTFELEDAAEAHRLMEEGGHLGKVVLTV